MLTSVLDMYILFRCCVLYEDKAYVNYINRLNGARGHSRQFAMSEQVASAAAESASLLKPGVPCRVAFLPGNYPTILSGLRPTRALTRFLELKRVAS